MIDAPKRLQSPSLTTRSSLNWTRSYLRLIYRLISASALDVKCVVKHSRSRGEALKERLSTQLSLASLSPSGFQRGVTLVGSQSLRLVQLPVQSRSQHNVHEHLQQRSRHGTIMPISRSLPGSFATTGTIPPTTAIDTSSTNTMAGSSSSSSSGSGFMNFTKTIIIPILVALFLYLLLFHALLPLYQRHRARYAQYLPLNTLPSSLAPSSLRSRLSSVFLRIFVPSSWPYRSSHTSHSRSSHTRRPSIPSTISEEEFDNASDRFSDDHGESMIGFDMSLQDQNRRRRDGMERQVARGILAAREMNAPVAVYEEPPPERRLSRELEEVFRDDSDSESEDDTRGVTVGRRSLSVSRR